MLLDRRAKSRGLDFKKLVSGMTGIMMITMGMIVILPMTAPNAEAWMTPDAGLMLNFDDLVMMSGGAVIGAFPNYQINDPVLTIAPSDTIVLMGGEDVMCAPGGVIEVLGNFDGMMGMGAIFHGMGIPGDWQGFRVMPMGNFMINGVGIFDAFDGVFADNTIMTNIDGCFISNCLNSGITYNTVMGGPLIGFSDISFNGVGIISTDSSSQIIGNNIHDNLADGIMLAGWAGPMLDNNDIYANQGDGIAGLNLDGSAFINNDVYDNRGSGVSFDNSFADFMGNRIYGWNATPGSNLPGGNAVEIMGTANFGIWMNGNTIMGGNGDTSAIGMPRPDGGHGIYTTNYEGNAVGWPQLNIDNNPLIKGGDGGPNALDNTEAGFGGDAIRINGVPDMGDPFSGNHALRIANNVLVLGGQGGNNNAAMNGVSGDGGNGIYVYDDDMIGSVNISGNGLILGGAGGDSSADDPGGGNWQVGKGGEGISLIWLHFQVINEVKNNQMIIGGKGGNTTGVGMFGNAGLGGNGIGLYGTTNSTILANEIIGGDGGNNSGMMIVAGNGGHGISLDYYGGVFISIAVISNSDSSGGEGGDDFIGGGGPMPGGAGTGGNGLSVTGAFSSGMTFDCNLAGGNGGDTYGDGGFAGTGGRGIHVWNGAGTSSMNSGTISGGNGGNSLYNGPPGFGSWGGNGGFGIWAPDPGTTLYVDGQDLITGGDGGDNWFDPLGGVGNGEGGVYSMGADQVTVSNSDITSGRGGFDWPSGTSGLNGTVGVMVSLITFGATITGNTIYDCELVGIYQDNTDGTIQGNTISDMNANGLGIESCSPYIDRNMIDNSTNYGIAFRNSNSLVDNCTVTNSGLSDFYLTSDSHPISLNTSSDKTVIINDALSDLTMQWYMHTQVVDQFLAPVGGAEVWINDTFGTNIRNAFTPADGWLRWTVVTEFIENQAARTYYTDHNGTAISGMQQGWATPEPTMDATRDVIIVLGASVYNIFLNQGWNLISIPLIPTDTSIDAVLATIAGQWDYIRVYDPLSPEPWLSNATFKPDQLNDFDTLDHTQGFWIDVTSVSATLTVTGTEPVTTNIPLYAGWNLVGYPSFVDMSIGAALAGTGYDRPVEGFDISEPYDIKQLPDTYFMTVGEAYWIHVPVDTIWMVENNVAPSMPYPVFGFVYLYNGTSAGGYAPLASMGGATVEVTWWDVYNGWNSIFTVTNPIGQYSVDLLNYTDGGIVFINATFDAPFGNMGYNYTYIDIMMGMSMQEVVCGVPYVLFITNPPDLTIVTSGVPFLADYVIFDRDGMVAQGYFTFSDGPMGWTSADPLFIPPPSNTFDGTLSTTPGIGSDMLTLFTPPFQTIWVYEGAGSNLYLTPWGEFYIDPDSSIPGWYFDVDYCELFVV